MDDLIGLCFKTKSLQVFGCDTIMYYKIMSASPTTKGAYLCMVVVAGSTDCAIGENNFDVLHHDQLSKFERVGRDDYDNQFYRALGVLIKRHLEN